MKSFGGQIPSSIFNISSLKAIALANNSLSGNLPDSLCHSLLKLEGLFLDRNELSGNLSNMLLLSLDNNKLSGSIPSSIGLRNLQALDLSSNKLGGPISESICGLERLATMYLSSNKLHGPVLACLGDMISLRLEGEIPANGCFPNFSSTSFMNNSALCGPPRLLVPPCKNNIHKNSKMILHALRYGLPAIGIAIVLIVLHYYV
ncbi:hypothetical protein V6N13_121548 [Hibiscus sabdariffa]